jgi:adenylate cyclase
MRDSRLDEPVGAFVTPSTRPPAPGFNMTIVAYHNSKTIAVDDLSLSLLQISLKYGIPHIHECGGRAKCSTCRVIICKGAENVQPRNAAEELLAKQRL